MVSFSSLTPISSKRKLIKTIGILKITKKTPETLSKDNEKLNLSIIGIFIFDIDISINFFENTVESVILHGKLIASKEIKMIVNEMN